MIRWPQKNKFMSNICFIYIIIDNWAVLREVYIFLRQIFLVTQHCNLKCALFSYINGQTKYK